MSELKLSYYLNWHGLEDFAYDFDEQGIPRVQYAGAIGLKYNAITISQWGLHNLQLWENGGDENALAQALKCAEWLAEGCRPWRNDSLAWIYDFGFDLYGPHPPWISGMAQGEAISLLLRCYQIAQVEQYLDVCRRAVRVFHYPVEQGGVMSALNDLVFFQEYPLQNPVHVLNGGIFALWGVYDYAAFFRDQAAMMLTEQCLEALRRHWSLWDVGYWTRYDLYPLRRLASRMYQELHVRQFRALAELFAEPLFAQVADRWQEQLDSRLTLVRWAAAKGIEKIHLALRRR
jgi:hypothetical protein